MFTFTDVSKSFGSQQILAGINLEIIAEGTTVLIGPSGCGKSTLLKLMLGLHLPDSGHVTFAGTPLTAGNVVALRQKMGYVVQDGGLFPHLTGFDNVTLMAKLAGWTTASCQKRVNELTEVVQLPKPCLEKYPLQLSGGQKQRLSLMRALMLDPAVLLLDEPMGALDPLIRADLQADLRDIFRQLKKTVVVVTHEMGEAAYLGDTVVLLRQGSIEQTGPFSSLLSAPTSDYVSQFINAQRSHWEDPTHDQ